MLILPAVLPPLLLLFAANSYCGTGTLRKKHLLFLFMAGGIAVSVAGLVFGDLLQKAVVAGMVPEGIPAMLFGDFVAAALVEEGSKYLLLRRCMHKGNPFAAGTEAIVLSATVTMGFSFFEQMLYTLGETIYTVLLRAVVSVPGHFAHAVFMGCFLHLAARAGQAGDVSGQRKYRILALVVPVLTHGIYDMIVSIYTMLDAAGGIVFLFLYVLLLLLLAVRLMKRMKMEERDRKG